MIDVYSVVDNGGDIMMDALCRIRRTSNPSSSILLVSKFGLQLSGYKVRDDDDISPHAQAAGQKLG